jgi:hypothetical protein
MNTNTNSHINLFNSIATAALWMAIPASIALGFSFKAFNALFPSWFFPSGCLLQVALYVALLVYVDKRAPHESIQARIGSLLAFCVPLPIYIMADSPKIDWSAIHTFSPLVAWSIPLLLIGLTSFKTAIISNKE